jgi:hypothetical protein
MTPFYKLFKGTIICALFFTTLQTKAANFYWLAGHYDTNWFDGRNWSHTPGGTAIGNSCSCAGTDYPGTNDDVFIDASIGGQINFSSLAIQMKSMTWSGTPTATTELYGSGAMSVFGSLVFVSNMKVNISYLNLYGSGGSDVITTAGNDMKDCATYIGSGTYGLTGDYTASGNYGTLGLGGTFSTNNYSILANDITVSNSSAVVFNMGSSSIQVVNFNMNFSPGSQTLTINPGTSNVYFSNNFIGSNKTYYSVTKFATSVSGINLIGGGNTFTNLTINAGVSCVFSGTATQTITGSLTVVGTSANRITLANYGSGSFTLVDPNGSAMAYVDITNGIANNTGTTNEFTTTNSTKTNCHGWDRTATPITFANVNKNYGAASFSMTASSTSTGTFTYSIISGNTLAVINSASGAVSIAGAGLVTVKASQAGDLDYLPNSTTATLTIAKVPLTITANNKSRVYGTANPTFDFNYSGFVNSETSSALISLPTTSTSATTASGVNTYSIVPSGGSAVNYSLTYVNGTLTITPASITVTVNNATRTYGAANPSFSYSYSGFVNGDNASAFQTPFSTPTAPAVANSSTGTYAINANGGNVGPNYSVTIGGYTVNAGTLTITQAPLTVTANNKSKVYGAANPTFDFSYNGFLNGETASVFTSSPTASTSATTASGVNTYSIVPSGGTATNYSFSYVNGTLSITQAPLTVIANNASRVYGTQNPAFTFSYSGFVNGDNATVLNVQPTATTTATAQSNTGTYPITPSGGAASNYSLATFQPGTLTITKANQTITFAPLTSLASGSGSIDLTATSSSGLPVSYASSDLSVATISGITMTIVGTGTANITASQVGDGNFDAATPVTQIQVVKIGQIINFTALPSALISDAPFDLSATSSSGLAVTFTSADPTIASISGNTVTIVAAGSVDITAHQPGDATYVAASDVTQTLVINKLDQTITFSALDNHLLGDQPFLLSATSSSGLTVTYSSSNTSVASVSGNTVTISGTGKTNITASQPGNNTYAQATDVIQELTIKLITAIEPPLSALQEVYPNPTTGLLHFTLQHEGDVSSVKLFDIRGGEIVVDKSMTTTEQLHVVLDISSLSPGMYLLRNGVNQAVKIIKN